MKILVLHGPSLGLLGTREPEVYGTETLAEIDARIRGCAAEISVDVEIEQHDGEGELVRAVHRAGEGFDGLVVNPAAYTHTSVALRDALAAVAVPAVEVHLSVPAGREAFRRRNLVAGVVTGQVAGFGGDSYLLALRGLISVLETAG